jgi:LPS export ABC transporter protein LptC
MRTKLLIFLFPALLAIALTSCENDIATVNLVGTLSDKPLESGKDVELIYSDSARIKVKLFAPQLDRYVGEKARIELPKGVKVEFFDNQMHVKTKLTANYGVRYEGEKRIEVRNDVVVINEKKEQLNTEHLVWDEATKKIYTNDFVRITTAEEVIFGDGLEANEDFSNYTIKNIKGTITKDDMK